MNVSTMVRMAALSAVAAFAVACGESPVAPAAPQTGGLMPPSRAAMSPNFLLSGDGTTTSTITIDPTVTAFYPVGPHWVYIPAGALCAQGTSYGIGEWDKDCVSATQKLTMNVSWGERNGRGVVEFHTDVRFKPTTSALKAVYLFMQEPSLSFDRYGVLWRNADGTWVDEARTDSTLRAFRVNGVWVGRRVKHFSGYNVALGMYEEQSDPTVVGGAQ